MTNPKKLPSTAFKPGQSGNLAGKPRGARNHATRSVLAMLEGSAEEVTKAVLEAAKGGDLSAAKFILERIAPPVRERPISMKLPDTSSIEGIEKAQSVIIEAVGAGELLPGEGTTLSALIENRRRSIETVELEQRISALEGKTK